jgi:hypothetical protein
MPRLPPQPPQRIALGSNGAAGCRRQRLPSPCISRPAATDNADDFILGVRVPAVYRRIVLRKTRPVILLLALPVMALVALAIKLDSPGPVLFRQKRFGFNNDTDHWRHFWMMLGAMWGMFATAQRYKAISDQALIAPDDTRARLEPGSQVSTSNVMPA